MHSTTLLFSVLISLTFTLNSAFAANICAYTNRGCGGSYACCNNLSAGTCCSWARANSALGWSLRALNMTGSWRGTCYANDSCYDQLFTINGGGSNVCVSVSNTGTRKWGSARWNWNSRTSQPEAVDVSDTNPCREPDAGVYISSNQWLEFNIAEGQFERFARLIGEDNYEILNRTAAKVKV